MWFLRTGAFLWLLSAVAIGTVSAAPPPARPETGKGVLLVKNSPAHDNAGGRSFVVIYREPGIGRIGELRVASLPALAGVVKTPPGVLALAVTATKGEWLRVHYDDAGRSGWLEPRRTWTYLTWEEYLRGKTARLLRGLRKEFYLARSGPDGSAPELPPLTPERSMRILDVDGDRARVLVDLSVMAWLRWRDPDGRLLITVE